MLGFFVLSSIESLDRHLRLCSLYDHLPISSETLLCRSFHRKQNPRYIKTFKSYQVYRGKVLSQTFTVTATVLLPISKPRHTYGNF